MSNTLRIRLLLAMQAALLGSVSSNIRVISCGFDGDDVRIKVIFDGAIPELDRGIMDEVGTELASHFDGASVEVECARIDAPQDFRDCLLDWCVYLRRE
ncbi:hypothetical protein [Cupriavidus sp. BIS7]|uniref:hypothetical protein n=1 Tax=Cupriavidus sp. BIS7 TaxID=1217718 RepID=UPI0003606758|nr:hypothetical protein [Cupriavidus sp. BIS7]